MAYPEVLAPAGDQERLEAAIRYGADAVYLGATMFGMRATAANFDPDQLQTAVEYCHKHGVKLYLTCNVLPTNEEIPALKESLLYWDSIGVDALIVSDIGVFGEIRRILPDMELHVSTQAGVVNYLAAREFYNMGAKRVVLAREMSLEDIKIIRDNTPLELEIEAFVHGAMCVSFSGRCLISQYMTGRDANHGECAQSCRWKYHLVEEKRPNEYYPVVEEEGGTYFFNAKDLNMLAHLDKLYKAGVSSFKIEGRAKSFYYVSVTTNAYRGAVDILKKDPDNYKLPQWLEQEVYKISHRDYTTGFYLPSDEIQQCYESGGYIRSWEVVGVVTESKEDHIVVEERNFFEVGDQLEILEPGKKPTTLTVDKLFTEDGEEVTIARHPMDLYKIPTTMRFAPGSIVRMIKN